MIPFIVDRTSDLKISGLTTFLMALIAFLAVVYLINSNHR